MKEHPRYPGLHLTETGEVWAKLGQWRDANGYAQVTIKQRGGRTVERVHVLVAEAFHGPRPKGSLARHLNGDNQDNRAENLAWGSPLENTADRIRHGRKIANPRAKLTLDKAQDIYDRRKAGESVRSLCIEFGISKSLLMMVMNGQRWPELRRS